MADITKERLADLLREASTDYSIHAEEGADRTEYLSAYLADRLASLAPEGPDYIVKMWPVIMLRVEGMPESMVKAHFIDLADEQGLAQKLRDAVEPTDFFIDFDLSDLEVEED